MMSLAKTISPGPSNFVPETAAKLDNVTVKFETESNSVVALRSVSLHLTKGELLVFVGRSGSGKTTALNVLAGLEQPSSGSATVLGLSPKAARPKLGYMFARDALLPWRSALDNIKFGLEIRGVSRNERSDRAREYLELMHLIGYAANLPHQLSQGQRQRVSMARTWAMHPEVLLMDEPFSALDAQTRESLHEEFIRLWVRDKRSIVFVTHDLMEAITLADRILVFSGGRVVKELQIPFERPRDLNDLAIDPKAQGILRAIREALSQ